MRNFFSLIMVISVVVFIGCDSLSSKRPEASDSLFSKHSETNESSFSKRSEIKKEKQEVNPVIVYLTELAHEGDANFLSVFFKTMCSKDTEIRVWAIRCLCIWKEVYKPEKISENSPFAPRSLTKKEEEKIISELFNTPREEVTKEKLLELQRNKESIKFISKEFISKLLEDLAIKDSDLAVMEVAKESLKVISGIFLGSVGTPLNNGLFVANLDHILLDIEDESGVNPGELVYRFKVMVGNTNLPVLRFDSIKTTTLGKDTEKKEDLEHFNTFQYGKPGQLEEINLSIDKGVKIVATTPEKSIPLPEKFVVELKLNEETVGRPLIFVIKEGDIKQSKKVKDLKNRSKKMLYSGISPKELLKVVYTEAFKWNPNASLRNVGGNKYSTYGDPVTKQVSEINIPEWRYTFFADGKICSFIASNSGITVDKEFENEFKLMKSLSPLVDWKIDINEAVKIVATQGRKLRTIPWLRMYDVNNKKVPLWVMPGSPSILIDALTGRVIPHKKVNSF